MINTTDNNKTGNKFPSPTEFLKQAFGRQVTVQLNNDSEYRGINE
jgi:small nuclear ribonucleoprotein (snRNP)-like protein